MDKNCWEKPDSIGRHILYNRHSTFALTFYRTVTREINMLFAHINKF
jgi:hypothetical protein